MEAITAYTRVLYMTVCPVFISYEASAVNWNYCPRRGLYWSESEASLYTGSISSAFNSVIVYDFVVKSLCHTGNEKYENKEIFTEISW